MNKRNIGVKLWDGSLQGCCQGEYYGNIDMRANDKDRVRVDVVWNQQSVSDPRHYAGI